jgi:hypothetical protein
MAFPKCPKCRRRNIVIKEIWDAGISWSPGDPYYNEGVLEPGDPRKVEGECLDCGHKWTFRCIVQVKLEWFDNEKG